MSAGKPKVLVVDDEQNILKTMAICFEALGLETQTCIDSQDVPELLRQQRFDLAFVDLRMAPLDGLEILAEFQRQSPDTTVTIITAHGSIDSAIDAIKKGAYYYLQKPFDLKELHLFAQRALQHHQLTREVRELRQQVAAVAGVRDFVTRNRQMLAALDLAARVAESTLSVLIEGESGTGKELVAEFIHRKSPRANQPLIKVNCAALPESLLESELFGHVKGAFTGALKDRKGRFELADGGTLFLDEVAELSPAIQAKLLRVLQNKEFERVGESETRKVDVRIIAATNKNLDEAMREGAFREDLFYRLNGTRIRLLPLRERPEDLPLLIRHILPRLSPERPVEVSAEAYKALRAYRWSGNIREFENVMQRAVVLARHRRIELQHLPEEIAAVSAQPAELLSLEEVEKRHIRLVLQQTRDYDEAAHVLGIDPATLWRKRKRYGL